jgi:DNA-directed RNA polymerase alpha subunit
MEYDRTCHDSRLHRPLPPNIRSQCVRRVEIALKHGSREQALAAIREAFDAAGQSPVEFGSSVYELRMPLRAAEALDEYGILTVGALSRCTEDELRSNTRLGAKSLEAVRAALKRVGMSLREPGQVRITEGETDESEDEEANRDCD